MRSVFWTLVLGGVFLLGIGYGKTIGGDEQASRDEVEVEIGDSRVEATLPTRTITQTRTVTVRATPRRGARTGAAR